MDSVPQMSRAAVLDEFGDASRLHVAEVLTPVLKREDEMLVRVHATSINPLEWKMRQGMGLPPLVWRRLLGRPMILGFDFSGTVARVGRDIQGFQVGDEVMGAMPLHGTYAQYVLVRPSDGRTAVVRKPAGISHAQAALVPFAGLVAYSGLVKYGRLQTPSPQARILVVGASGGVGHLAVQMARRGLEAAWVVGVCSSRNADFVRGCGAHEVISYDRTPPEAIVSSHPDWAGRFDLIFDTIGVEAYWTEVAPKLLAPHGQFVTAALPPSRPGRPGEDVSPLGVPPLLLKLVRRHRSGRYHLIPGLLGGLPSHSGLPVIARWLEEGKVSAHPAAAFDLEQIAEAHRASEGGRTVGKLSVRVP
ncbi:NADPH:quinone reductase [Stigmatella aurantiaca]|uniref:NADPH:quinone reductase n=2 Tax=Stigmatella aurantiaca TaxID=41 RepID=A0A1H8FAS9_STIAU|nr:NADPH:quinone reductase [Stigmatella aurantiaca]